MCSSSIKNVELARALLRAPHLRSEQQKGEELTTIKQNHCTLDVRCETVALKVLTEVPTLCQRLLPYFLHGIRSGLDTICQAEKTLRVHVLFCLCCEPKIFQDMARAGTGSPGPEAKTWVTAWDSTDVQKPGW